jgi:ketosteroid isomerase-like protein
MGIPRASARDLKVMDTENDKQLIRGAIEGFITSYRSSDLKGILSYYSEDLLKLRQGADPETKKQTADRIAEVFQKNRTDILVTVDEIVISGNLAFARGTFEVILTPKNGGDSTQIQRRYLEIWRKEAGVWRVFRTMDN